jgi:hypothetical protein
VQHNRTSLAMFPVVAACITAPALETLLAAGLMQGKASRGLAFPSRYLRLNRSLLPPEMDIVARGFFASLRVSDHFQWL